VTGDASSRRRRRQASFPFVDDQAALNLLDIRTKAREVQQRHGPSVLIVDYMRLCSSGGAFDKRHHQIEQISRGMKQLLGG
jgi:replicative DNA helicase